MYLLYTIAGNSILEIGVIITFHNGASKLYLYNGLCSLQYISHNSFPETMMRVNLIIKVKEFTLYIINNYCKTHLFTNALSRGHWQIQ